MIFGRKAKQAEYIVDVHCHILPGIDDGSRSMEETLKMLRIAADEGITHVIATPHYKLEHNNATPGQVDELIDAVQAEASKNNIPIVIYQGNEVLFFNEFDEYLENKSFCRMNYGDYVLTEFLPTDRFSNIRNAVDDVLSMGCVPIVAHVERYECMASNIENVRTIRNMGADIQINASSVTGGGGKNVKKFVHSLLKEQLVDYIGTDAHRCEGSRVPNICECSNILYKKYDEKYVDSILYGNAMDRIIQ